MSDILTIPPTSTPLSEGLRAIRDYWDTFLHDQEMSRNAVGSPAWFADLAAYRSEKLAYLSRMVDFHASAGQEVLEIGCGIGLDLARFARGGARVTGIDLAPRAIALADQYLRQQQLHARLTVMNGEAMSFPDESFDLVYAHGVVQYTENPQRLVHEIWRVLRPQGTAILMVYHRHSWLMWMTRLTGVRLEHDDAPAFRTFTQNETRALLQSFRSVHIVPERFPVATKLHKGWKAAVYNRVFVPGFQILPHTLTDRWGWHLMIWARK
jgi:SAM-dependent methyltransferase